MKIIAECPVCGINIYDRAEKNRSFTVGKTALMGYFADSAKPCGIDRSESTLTEDKVKERCPFETKEEQNKITFDLSKIGALGKGSNYD